MSVASYHDCVFGEFLSDRLDKLNKVLRIAVRHVQADVLQGRDSFQDSTQLLQICTATAWAGSYMLWGRVKFDSS